MLAVSLSIGWRAAIGASLATGIDVGWVQLVGVFLLLFGVRWLAKAMARHAGLKAYHDEALEFEQTRARLGGNWVANWMVACKGVLLAIKVALVGVAVAAP